VSGPELEYFAGFLPLAARVAPTDRTIAEVLARQDEQSAADPTVLGEDAAVLRHVLTEADAQWQEQARLAHALPDYWRGPTAERAQAAVLRNLDHADRALTSVRVVVDAIDAAQTALGSVLRHRAEALGAFPATIDGHSPDDVARMIDQSDGERDEHTNTWLEQVFMPHVRESLEVFDDICRAADDAIGGTVRVLDQALTSVDAEAAGLASAVLSGVGRLVAGAGELAVDIGAGLIERSEDPSTAPDPPGHAERPSPHAPSPDTFSPETRTPPGGAADHGGTPHGDTGDRPESADRTAGQSAQGPHSRNEPAIAVDPTPAEPDVGQLDSSPEPPEPGPEPGRGGQPQLAGTDDDPRDRKPDVALGEAGPL
jgi:hypothetical protein